MKRALYIGRFQPFHLGHFNMVKEIEAMDEFDEMIIAVGSTYASHQDINPFTGGERIEMIDRSVRNAFSFNRTYVLGVHDIPYEGIWANHMISQLPKFDKAYTNNPRVYRIFKDAGVDVEKTHVGIKDRYSSTIIREMMMNDEDGWVYRVPPSVSNFIIENDLISRLKDVSSTDNIPRRS